MDFGCTSSFFLTLWSRSFEAGEISLVFTGVAEAGVCIWDVWAGVTVQCCSLAFSPGDSFLLFVNKFSSSNSQGKQNKCQNPKYFTGLVASLRTRAGVGMGGREETKEGTDVPVSIAVRY